MNPYVKSVKPQENYCLLLTFENGEKRIFDLKPDPGKDVFTRLKNVAEFKTARVVSGSVEWRGEIDLRYDTRYHSSIPVKTSLKPARRRKKEETGAYPNETDETRPSQYRSEVENQKLGDFAK